MATNKQIIEKADMALADLAGGGALTPEQSETFIEKLEKEPTLLSQMRIIKMAAPTREINKIGLGEGILKPAPVAGVGLAEPDRVKPYFEKVELVSKKVMAEMRIPYDVIEDNIERGSVTTDTENASDVRETIINMIVKRAAGDLENMAVNGDTASADPLLAMMDGFLKSATSHVVDNAGAGPTNDMFVTGLKNLPVQYHRNMNDLRNYVNNITAITYQQTMANRQTALGDASITQMLKTYGGGVEVERAPFIPVDQGMLTIPQNMIFGIQRDMTLEYERMISEQMFKIVLSMRVDFKLEEEDAMVKYINI